MTFAIFGTPWFEYRGKRPAVVNGRWVFAWNTAYSEQIRYSDDLAFSSLSALFLCRALSQKSVE